MTPRIPFVLGIGLLCLTGCALPPPDFQEQRTVASSDIVAVSLVREGTNLYSESRFPEAELKFRQALYLFPDAANVQASLAAALEGFQRYDEALALYQQLSTRFPKESSYRIAIARVQAALGQVDQAIATLRDVRLLIQQDTSKRGIELLPVKEAAVLRTTASLLFRAGREQEAACAAEEAFVASQAISDAVFATEMLNARGMFAQSLVLSTKALTGSADIALLLQHGIALLGVGRGVEARQVFERVLDAEDGSGTALGEARALLAYLDRTQPSPATAVVAVGASTAEPEDDAKALLPVVSTQTLTRWPIESAKQYLALVAAETAALEGTE